jgi:hypothetical protein
MRAQFALCAQGASTDRASNRLTIVNVIDHIPASALPIFLPSLTFVTVFESDHDESATYRGIFEGKVNDERIVTGEVLVTFVNGRLARVVLTINNVPIRAHGILSFRLAIPDQAVAEVTLPVIDISQRVVPPTPISLE